MTNSGYPVTEKKYCNVTMKKVDASSGERLAPASAASGLLLEEDKPASR